MGVKVLGREYANRYRPEIVDWLLGNTGDWQKITLDCLFSVDIQFSQSEPLLLENGGLELVLANGKEWRELGFDVGDTINWELRFALLDSSGAPSFPYPVDLVEQRQVVLLQGDRMTINAPWIVDIGMVPFNNNQYRLDNSQIWVDKQPEAAEVIYGHLTNTDSNGANLSSFIDGTITRILAEGLNTLTGWNDCEFIGLQSGMSLRSSRWIYDGKQGDFSYRYRFEIEFMISSFFEDLDNFENLEAPSQLFDSESLTDNFEVIGYPQFNNPNTQIKSDKQETKMLGNTGWFNENYNGLDNDFTVTSLEYTDVVSSQPVQRLSYGSDTRVKAVISGIPNLADGLTKCGIGFILVPEDEDLYKNKPTPYHQNLFVNTAGGVGSGVFVPTPSPNNVVYTGYTNVLGVSMNVRDIHFYIQGTDLVYEATFSPTAGFASYAAGLDEVERNYVIWVSISDRTEITNFSDRVSLLLDYNFLDLFVVPVGEFDPMVIKFAEHPYTEDEVRDDINCLDLRVEDDLVARAEFEIDITKDIPNRMEFVFEVENVADGQKYELQRFSVDLSGFPVDGAGVPQWNFDQIRGFKLEAGNSKNWVKVQRNPSADNGDNKGYVVYYGFKIRWEDWLARTGVPNDFFDSNLGNNGFNNDWFHYANNPNWSFQFTINTFSTLNGAAVKYVNSKQLAVKDYDVNPLIDVDWEFIREADGSNLPVTIDGVTGKPLGILLDGERVRLKVIYNKNSGTFATIGAYYGTICLEVDKGAGQFEFRQLSTVVGSEIDNPLVPLDGQTRVVKTLVSPTQITLECLVEPSLLQDAIRYKLSSRLGCMLECNVFLPTPELDYNSNTKLKIYFDSSGSMDDTLTALTTMRNVLLKNRLLPLYNNDGALYDANVTITNVANERTWDMMNFENQPPPTGNVVVMVFQDEAFSIYHQGGINPISSAYASDLGLFRSRLDSFGAGYYRGAIFQVATNANAEFKNLLMATQNGTPPYDGVNGLSDRNEIGYYYDITDGDAPSYYLNLVVDALEDFGFIV